MIDGNIIKLVIMLDDFPKGFMNENLDFNINDQTNRRNDFLYNDKEDMNSLEDENKKIPNIASFLTSLVDDIDDFKNLFYVDAIQKIKSFINNMISNDIKDNGNCFMLLDEIIVDRFTISMLSNMMEFKPQVRPSIVNLLSYFAFFQEIFFKNCQFNLILSEFSKMLQEDYNMNQILEIAKFIDLLIKINPKRSLELFKLFKKIHPYIRLDYLLLYEGDFALSITNTIHDFIKIYVKNNMFIESGLLVDSINHFKQILVSIEEIFMHIKKHEFILNSCINLQVQSVCVDIIGKLIKMNQVEIRRHIIESSILDYCINIVTTQYFQLYCPTLKVLKYCFTNGQEFTRAIASLIKTNTFGMILKTKMHCDIQICGAKCLISMLSNQKQNVDLETIFSPVNLLLTNEEDLLSIVLDNLSEQNGGVILSFSKFIYLFLSQYPTSQPYSFSIELFVEQCLKIIEKDEPELIVLMIKCMIIVYERLSILKDLENGSIFVNKFNDMDGKSIITREISESFIDSDDTEICFLANALFLMIYGEES